MYVDKMLGVYVPPEVLFPEVVVSEDNIHALLKQLSLTDTLFWCARINAILSNRSLKNKEKQNELVNLFFSNDDIAVINDYLIRYQKDAERSVVFFRFQILEVAVHALAVSEDLPGDGQTFSEKDTRDRFNQCALIASELWGQRVYKYADDAGDNRKWLGCFRRAVETTRPMPSLGRVLGRSLLLFTNLINVYDNRFAQRFEEISGVSLEDYFDCCCFVLGKLSANESGFDVFDENYLQNTRYHQVWAQFVSRYSIEVCELQSKVQNGICEQESLIRILRNTPLIKTANGQVFVIDKVLFSELIKCGPLFTVARQNTNVFSAFGYAFERYINDILTRVFDSHSLILAQRYFPNLRDKIVGHNDIEIDGFLHEGHSVVLFEMKSSFLADNKISASPEELVEVLDHKYFMTEGEKNKGITQLSRIIRYITDGLWNKTPSGLAFNRNQMFYPVLVVHDELLTVPIYTEYLAAKFEESLGMVNESGVINVNGFKIAPLIVMSIEDIEDIEFSLNDMSFIELLRLYSMDVADRKISFHDYARWKNGKIKLVANESLNKVADERLKTLTSGLKI